MIPVTEKCTRLVEIEKEKYVDYLKSEINKTVTKEIITKVSNMFKVLENNENIDYTFFKEICCNFKKLEKIYKNYKY